MENREPPDWLFLLEGDFWTIVFEGRLVRLKDAKGLKYLAHLLRHPGRRVHVGDLLAVGGGGVRLRGTDTGVERVRKAVTNRIRGSIARIRIAHAQLGLHLRNAVHTGTICSYTPDRPPRWFTSPPG